MTKLQQRIIQTDELLKKLRAEERERKRIAKLSDRGRGREPIPAYLIEKARTMAQNKPLRDVALSLGISLRTLYNYKISREALNNENKV